MGCVKCGGDETQYCADCEDKFFKKQRFQQEEITLKNLNQEIMILKDQIQSITNSIKSSYKDESNKEFINNLRESFFYQLDVKTNWGRNQIKEIFNVSIDSLI